MDKNEYKRINELLCTHVNPPTDKDVDDTISVIEQRMVGKDENTPVFKGYKAALTVLCKRNNKIPDIKELDSIQARSIAFLAIDYLNGDCVRDILTNIPLQDKKK